MPRFLICVLLWSYWVLWHQNGILTPFQESNKCAIINVLQHLIHSSTSLSRGLRHASSGRWQFYSPELWDRLMKVRTSNVSIAAASRGFWFYVKICPLPSDSRCQLHTWLQIWPISEPLRTSPDHNDKPRLRHMSPSRPLAAVRFLQRFWFFHKEPELGRMCDSTALLS